MRSHMALFSRLLFALVAAPIVHAQCPAWAPGFDRTPDFASGSVVDAAQFALPGGPPRLYVSGDFTTVAGQPIAGMARWDGASWTSVPGLPATLAASVLEVLDLGAGPALFAVYENTATNVASVARLDAAGWTVLGTLADFASVADMSAIGSTLYVGGSDVSINGTPQSGLVRWNGATWSADINAPTPVFVLETFDPGGGVRLYAGGYFSGTGSGAAANIASLSGNTWSPLGSGTNLPVSALVVHDFGAGPRLVAGGSFSLAGGAPANYAASWDGASWTALPGLPNVNYADSLVSHGGQLIAGCYVGGLHVWNATSFVPFAAPALPISGGDAPVNGLEWVDLGAGPRLVAWGRFASIAGVGSPRIAQFDGVRWDGFAARGDGFDNTVYTLAELDFLGTRSLYAGGQFRFGGLVSAPGLARWTGSSWEAVGTEPFATSVSIPAVNCVGVGDLGAGPALYAGGGFTSIGGTAARGIASWNGATWSPLGAGLGGGFNDGAACLAVFDSGSGPQLYAGGRFTSPGLFIARWNGASWAPVGQGIDSWFVNPTQWASVTALQVFDDGSGSKLYVGGLFQSASGVVSASLARWNGASWEATPGIPNGTTVLDLQVWRGELYIATVAGISRWNGAAVVPFAAANAGLQSIHLTTHVAGGVERLDAAGTFASLGGVPANRAASCDGTTWTALGTGLDGAAEAIAWHTGGSAGTSEIFVAGSFANAGGNVAARVAAWRLCTDQASFCAGDGSFADHTTPCPCGNYGASGNGCGHSFGVQGANLSATGAPSLDDVVLHAQFEPANSFTLMMQHANTADTVFHDGVLCAGNPLVRLRGRSAAGGEAFFPNSLFAVDATTTLSQRGGVFPGQGVRRYYAAWYRNASTTFCPPATANVTNGWRIDW